MSVGLSTLFRTIATVIRSERALQTFGIVKIVSGFTERLTVTDMGIKKKTRTRVEVVEKEETIQRSEVVETEEEIDVPVCDFCEQEYPEKDRGFLTPVVLNPQVETQRHLKDTVMVPHDNSFDTPREVYRALRQTRLIDFRQKQVMEEVPQIGPVDGKVEFTPFEDTTFISDGKLAYEFTINAPEPKVRGDGQIEVCEFCKEMFQ